MFAWLKKCFSCCGGACEVKRPAGCCGGQCCDHENQQPVASNQPPAGADFAVSEGDKAKLKTLDPLVVVGKVLEVRAHSNPEMTKVRVSQCDLGKGEVVQILCGGTNLQAGQIVAVAKVGCVLPGDFEIGERDIRGEMSYGMICASRELGLERVEEGKVIWPLPIGFEPFLGQSINQLV